MARIAGISIRVHATFLLLLWLVAAGAADAHEPVLESVGWVIAIFACIVVHELSHSMVARAKGIAVHEIDLLPFGGVSRLESIPEDWRDEFAIAVMGPVASVALAAVAFGAAALNRDRLFPPHLTDGALLSRLAWVNLLLAGFNLLPAFPMDGGRVLRALIERSQSRVTATARAVRISRVVAIGLIGAGLLGNIWFTFIGAFVLLAGGAEQAAVEMHTALDAGSARVLAAPCPTTLPAAMPVRHALAVVDRDVEPAYAVVHDDGSYAGVVTWHELVRADPRASLSAVASTTVVDASTSIDAIADVVREGPVAVAARGRFVGAITPGALERYVERLQAATARVSRTG